MPTYKLVALAGGQEFEVPEGRPLVVGRAVTSDLAIFDPTVSRAHAELAAGADGVRVRDLNSSNGTFVNGVRVTEILLLPHDSITFGKVVFQLRTAGDSSAPRPAEPQGGAIVRQVAVGAGPHSVIESLEAAAAAARAPGSGQLRVGGASEQERQARKLALLLEASQRLSGELDLDRLLGMIVDTTFEVMHVDRVAILLVSEATGDLVPRLSRSRLGDAAAQLVPRSIAQTVLRERVAVLSDNAAADARFTGQSVVMQSVRSAMCTPLLESGDRVLGILYVDNLTATNSFSDEDLQFLVAFGGLAAAGIKASRYAEQIRREALVRSNFERYFAPNVAAAIAREQGEARPGGEKRPIVVLFSDVRGFTALAESMTPDAIARLLSDYFSEMVEIVFEHGGTLDKFIGDALLALWGAPIAHGDDPQRALRAAIQMQRSLAELNRAWAAAGRPPLEVGIGINYGEVFAGNIGSHRRLEYTVIGDAVNVAARLCDLSGPGEILIGEPFYQALGQPAACEPLEPLALRGRARAVPVYRVTPDASGAPG